MNIFDQWSWEVVVQGGMRRVVSTQLMTNKQHTHSWPELSITRSHPSPSKRNGLCLFFLLFNGPEMGLYRWCWHWFYSVQSYKSTLLEQEIWDINFLSGPVSDRRIDRSSLLLLPVYDRLSLQGRIHREGRLRKEVGSDWVRMMLCVWCIGWQTKGLGEGVGWVEENDLTLACTLLYSNPCLTSFMFQPRVRSACCPRWCCLSGLPSTGCVPLTPATTDLYSFNWFQGDRPSFSSVSHTCTQTHTLTHTHTRTHTACQQLVPPVQTHIHAAGAVRCQR